MSDEERAELARRLAERKAAGPQGPVRKATKLPRVPVRPDEPDPGVAAAVARLTAELRRTERRLDRLERTVTHNRYQSGGPGLPYGLHLRLLTRADRLERELDNLR